MSDEVVPKALCLGKTNEGTQCRRTTKIGEKHCWQHAPGLKAKWHALSRNQSIMFVFTVFGVIGVMITMLAWVYPEAWKKTPFEPRAIVPDITVKVKNSKVSPVSLSSRGEFILWLPAVSHEGAPRIDGVFELTSVNGRPLQDESVRINPGQELTLGARIANQEYFYRMMTRGDTEITLVFRRSDQSVVFADTLPFTQGSIKKYYTVADAGER